VPGGAVEAVVVVPLEGGAFGPAVLDQVVDVGFAAAGLEQEVIAGVAGREAAGDLTVEGGRLALGEAARIAVEPGAVVAAVEVDREFPRALRQLVIEADAGAVAGAAADRRAGEAAAEGPELRLRAGEDLLLGLADRDLDVVAVEDRRDRQRLPERNRGERRRRLGGDRQQAAAPAPQGQEDGKSATAKGAEEGSAPEAMWG
jgi:hypothetical protein